MRSFDPPTVKTAERLGHRSEVLADGLRDVGGKRRLLDLPGAGDIDDDRQVQRLTAAVEVVVPIARVDPARATRLPSELIAGSQIIEGGHYFVTTNAAQTARAIVGMFRD